MRSFTLVFDNVMTGERTVIRAPEKEMLSNQFFNKYKRMSDVIKSRSGKFSILGEGEVVPEKIPAEVAAEVKFIKNVSSAAADALKIKEHIALMS